MRWTLKVPTWVQHFIGSHPFRSMLIDHPIPEIQHFQNLTLIIQGQQGHGWGRSWKSQSGCNILPTHIPFVPCQSTLLFLRYNFFSKFDLENPRWRWNGNDVAQNYRSRQFHITSNGINPSSGSRDMTSTKSCPSAASFDKFWAIGKPTLGKWANYYDSTQLQV